MVVVDPCAARLVVPAAALAPVETDTDDGEHDAVELSPLRTDLGVDTEVRDGPDINPGPAPEVDG
jgi:hypothetical protein